jgi:hypothetical protein
MSDLLEQERDYLEKARLTRKGAPPDAEPAPEGPPPGHPGRDLCGLALSGGGIRSATFNLGLLQGLQQLGLLGMFDYVATVSGGGYIGGFWTAWRHHARHGAQPGSSRHGLFPMNERTPRVSEPGARGSHLTEVRHLREFSNFLSPRLGLLSPDTGRLIVAALSAVIPALLASLSFLLLGLVLWNLIARALLIGWPTYGDPPRLPLLGSYALMLVLTCGGLLLLEWLSSRKEAHKTRTLVFYLSITLVVGAIVFLFWSWLLQENHVTAWSYQSVWMRGGEVGDLSLRERLYVFTPALVWLVATGALVLSRWLGSRFVTRRIQQPELATMDRVLSRLLLMAAVWSVIAAFCLCGRLLREFFLTRPSLDDTYSVLRTGLVGAVLGLTALFAKVQQLFGRKASKPVSPSVKSRAKSTIPQFLAYAVLSLILLNLVLLILGASDEGWLGRLVVGAVVITLLTVFLFDANIVGLHAFYRARIARTFIGAAHGEGAGQTEPHEKDDLPLDELKPGFGPLHLVCCAANDLASENPMANLYRGADSAVLSPLGFSVGSEGTTWERFKTTGAPVPTLASAMTASGAAFNSHMGSLSMRLGQAVTFLMTTFNLRLGLWLPHPTRARDRWFDRLCVGLPFYKELLGRSRVHGPNVLLSDGGHFENLALYELVRRHCRFILVSDCGMDSATAFDDFANAVRRVRDDFGVEIRIDLSPLRCEQDTPARQLVVAGDIEYPDGDTGVLLLIKPTLLGNEPADITQYKARNAAFPHESTGDQFYDEAQWEAYRRLGEHAALTAFRPVQGEKNAPEALATAQLFARARYEWLPVPSGYKERFASLVERAISLDMMLKDQGSRKLFREIYKEINELDLHAKAEPRTGEPSSGTAGLLGPTGERLEDSGPPSPQELADALHMIRCALLFMEEVFLTEELATYYNHPAYMGLMNYFARWAYAPLLRTWWPLLKTLYSPRFTHFLEERFSLPSMERKDVGRLSRMERGFARSCWTEQGGRAPRAPRELLISYLLELPHGRPEPQYHIQAAQLIVRTQHDDPAASPLLWGGRQVVVWQGDDFYVPPGLWGAGIGEDFLRLITSSRDMPSTVKSGSLLAVRLLVNRDASAARRKRWADDVQLYRSHGFSEPDARLRQWLCDEVEVELESDPALKWNRKHHEHWQPYWLTRTFTPTEGASTRNDALPEAPGHEEPAIH